MSYDPILKRGIVNSLPKICQLMNKNNGAEAVAKCWWWYIIPLDRFGITNIMVVFLLFAYFVGISVGGQQDVSYYFRVIWYNPFLGKADYWRMYNIIIGPYFYILISIGVNIVQSYRSLGFCYNSAGGTIDYLNVIYGIWCSYFIVELITNYNLAREFIRVAPIKIENCANDDKCRHRRRCWYNVLSILPEEVNLQGIVLDSFFSPL